MPEERDIVERPFPIQSERGAAPHPTQIPWSLAELAYSVYSAENGKGQSLERLAERGGFYPAEMDSLLPDWRERCDEITTLRARLAEAEKYGCPPERKHDTALDWVRKLWPGGKKKCNHHETWTTCSGSCMACRATEAEARAVKAEGMRDIAKHIVTRLNYWLKAAPYPPGWDAPECFQLERLSDDWLREHSARAATDEGRGP